MRTGKRYVRRMSGGDMEVRARVESEDEVAVFFSFCNTSFAKARYLWRDAGNKDGHSVIRKCNFP